MKELDNDLMEETEVMIREDFASAIEDKKPVGEMVEMQNYNHFLFVKSRLIFNFNIIYWYRIFLNINT